MNETTSGIETGLTETGEGSGSGLAATSSGEMIVTDIGIMTRAVTAAPTDDVAYSALVDALMESGCTRPTALRRARKIRQPAMARFRLSAARTAIGAEGRKGAGLRTLVRAAVGRASSSSLAISVIAGDSPPVLCGEEPYHTFREKGSREGGVCRNPGGAIRAGYRLEYHASTLAVTVGAEWVWERM